MPVRQQRSFIALAILIFVFVVGRPLVPKLVEASRGAISDTMEVSPEVRAAPLHFAPSVSPGDQAWILAAIATSRPEAQTLIGEIDGLVEIRTDLTGGDAIGLAEMGAGRAVVSFDVQALDGERAIDRNVAVLHELGHVIDYLLVSDEMITKLDAGIPTVGTCASWSAEPTGACTAVEERFADTFAKWALGGRVSLAGSGYGIPLPASIEDWGQPLGLLAAQLTIKARGQGAG
jgi:hypothetical protein